MVQATSSDYGYLRQMVFSISQNVLDSSRDYLFHSWLTKVLRNQGMSQLGDLVRLLQSRRDTKLERDIAEAMTINETSFFRDSRPFELLRNELLPPMLITRRQTRSLRFWSAACSSRQEAYSLAMMTREYFPLLASWNIRIEGTDICAEVVERAQAGRYHRIEINRGLPARFIVKYFNKVLEDWLIKPEIKEMCAFRQSNLCGPQFPFARTTDRFDVVFLRNVMLYFSPETRKMLLERIHRVLEPDGILFLGASEQPADPSLWTSVLAGGTCYFRKSGGREGRVFEAEKGADLGTPRMVLADPRNYSNGAT
jgi:chemotaxis protein methyltransferase CheR